MNFSRENLEKNIARATLLLLAITILGSILVLGPFFGLMDDHMNIFTILPEMKAAGIFSYSWSYGLADLGWGMFRPTNPLMIYALYAPIPFSQPWLLYAWNALLCFGLLYFSAKVWEKILNVPWWISLLFCGSFFYLYDLFQHPSLQEKMLILFGFAALYFLSREKLGRKELALALIACFLGVLVKASFILYFSMALWALFWHPALRGKKERWIYTGLMTAGLATATVFFAYVSSRGAYTTNAYSLSKVVPNLLSRDGVMFLGAILIFLAAAAYRKSPFRDPRLFTPVIGTLAFLTILLPWGITGYIQTGIGPVFCGLVAWAALAILPGKSRIFWLLPLCAIALGIGAYRSYTMFGRLADLGAVVARAEEWKGAGINELYMPCAEGRVALGRYFREISGVPITTIEISDYSPAALNGKWVFFDNAMCPLPGRVAVAPGCVVELAAFTGRFRKSYQIQRWHCGG